MKILHFLKQFPIIQISRMKRELFIKCELQVGASRTRVRCLPGCAGADSGWQLLLVQRRITMSRPEFTQSRSRGAFVSSTDNLCRQPSQTHFATPPSQYNTGCGRWGYTTVRLSRGLFISRSGSDQQKEPLAIGLGLSGARAMLQRHVHLASAPPPPSFRII